MTSPHADPDTSLLDLILGPPRDGAFLTTPGDETHNRPGYAIAYPNTVEGRAHYMADARTHQANGRNNFLSSVVWDDSVLGEEDLRLTRQTPALYYPTLWADVDNPNELDKARRGALEKRGHIRTRSGTPGRFHLRLPLDEAITDPAEFERLNLQLADALGGVDAAKSYPYMWLTTPGFTRFKPEYPRGKTVMMTSMNDGARWSANELRDLFASWGVEERAARTYAGDASIEPEAIDWDAVPESVRHQYDEIPRTINPKTGQLDTSYGCWLFWLWCAKRRLTPGQVFYISTELDPEGYIADKYGGREAFVATQIGNAFKPPPGKQTPPTDQVSGEKETGMRPTANHTNQRPKKMWGYGDIMSTQFSPPKFTVRNLIAPGATILIGAPKVGKSFWLLNLVLSVASGRQAFGHFDTRQTGVLYLYLEGGGARSIQSRIVSQQDEVDERLPIMFALEWDGFDEGGVAKLDSWLEEHSDVGLVVVDTLAAFRGGGTADRNPWKADYKVLSELSALGHKHDCAIVVAHHDKKGEESDFVDSMSGTKGLSAACDGIIKLDRERNTVEGKMRFVGRELADGFWNVEYEDLTWKVVDAPPLKKGAETLKAILDFVGTRHVKITEIIEALTQDGTYKAGAIRQCVHRAKKARHPRLMQDDDGRYFQP